MITRKKLVSTTKGNKKAAFINEEDEVGYINNINKLIV